MAELRRIVGRERELGVLRDVIDALPAGRIVVLEGEPGVGKSTLIDVALARANAAGAFTARTGADELGGARPLGLLAPFDESGGTATPDADRLLTLVDRAAGGRSWVTAFDDLQWADHASLAAVTQLARRAPLAGGVVVLAMRTWPRVLALDELLDRIGPMDPVTIRLGPLGADELRVLAEIEVGRPVGASLAGQLEGVGGNPFYALALLRALAAEGAIGSGGVAELTTGSVSDRPPAALASLVRRRVAVLGPDAERTLQHAAALGRAFGVSELAELVELPVSVTADHVARATDADLLRADGHKMAFRHDLLREALESSLPGAVLATLHRRAAEIVAIRGDLALSGAHLLRADVAPADVARIAEAVEHCSPVVALGLIERAMAVLAGDDPRRIELSIQRIDFLLWSGSPEEAIAAAHELLDAGVDEQRAYVLRATVAHALFVLGRPEEAVATWPPSLDGTDPVLRAGELAEMAFATLFAGRLGQAAQLAEQARSLADGPTSTAISSVVTAWVLLAAGDAERAAGWAARAVDASVHADETARRLGPRLVRSMTLDELGEGVAALAEIWSDQQVAGDRASAVRVPFRHSTAAIAHFRAGRWDDARAEAESGRHAAEDLHVASVDGWLRAVPALVALHRDGPAAAADELAGVGPVQLGADWLWWVRGLIDAARGDPSAAIATLDAVASLGAAVGSFASALLVAPDLLRLTRGGSEARPLAEAVLDICRSAPLTGLPNLQRLALAEATFAGDAVGLMAAADRLAACRPLDAVEARHLAAVLLAERSDPDARPVAMSALDGYGELGATWSASRLRAEMRSHGVRLRLAAAAGRGNAITPTEQLVVDLVVDGLTNGEIAERLLISRRTVESHLVHVYAKLGITGRQVLIDGARR